MAGIRIPNRTRILVAGLSQVGNDEPLSREKLTTVLGWYEVPGREAGLRRCRELIHLGGFGHSLVIHATDQEVILRFALEEPVFRILVNTLGSLGATGMTTGLTPSLTLGSGGLGGSISSDNITTTQLLNIKRVAYEIQAPPVEAMAEVTIEALGEHRARTRGVS